MIAVFVKWLICVAGAWAVVVSGIRLAGCDAAAVIRRYFPALCVLVYCVAAMAEIGGSKPPAPPAQPTVNCITLGKPLVSANAVNLAWIRDDGQSSVGRVYNVYYRRRNDVGWKLAATVRGVTSATVPGFWAGEDVWWKVEEQGHE